MRKLLVLIATTSMLFALGVGSAFAGNGNGGGSSPTCPVQSPQGAAAAAMNKTVGPPCGYAVGKLGICPPHSPNAGNSGPPCGKSSPPPPPPGCGVSNPPTGLVSGPLFSAGEALNNANSGFMPIGNLVEQVACAVFTNIGL